MGEAAPCLGPAPARSPEDNLSRGDAGGCYFGNISTTSLAFDVLVVVLMTMLDGFTSWGRIGCVAILGFFCFFCLV